MITNNEITAVELSPTKRDFYQIWNELIDTASKLSNRWDPSSTNESDPGIVLLKVLTAIADKLNYTIDKNTLEAFMPSATQEESMRKLCDMLGYNMKYYRSATCSVQISYTGTDYDLESDYNIIIPKFTNIKNQDQDINYVTQSAVTLGGDKTSDTVEVMEGEYVEYENITRDQLDDNHRYYLPEVQIAENGIFLTTADDKKLEYEKVTNLNTQKLGTYCWKFGYDSKEDTPYIEFPEDIDSIIGEGINFAYIRTNGANGNVSATLLNTIDSSSCQLIHNNDTANPIDCEDSWFSISNVTSATNGADKESIDEAYIAYKKTIGTFDTLVSCRDYINKIYQLTEGDIDGTSSTTPLVSNIIVSDIRDDINRGATVCSFSENGVTYNNTTQTDKDIDNFQILLYPFKRVTGSGSKAEYKNSFKYSNEMLSEIKTGINENKTISHKLESPEKNELACIKDLIKVKAKITTTEKVNSVAEKSILYKVFLALYNNFNMRKVDFGEEITDEMITKVIINADSRIKNVQLSTDHSLAFEQVDGTTITSDSNKETYENTFLNLALLNILAGRMSLFKYDESFEPSLDESRNDTYDVYYPSSIDTSKELDTAKTCVTKIITHYKPSLPTADNPLKINDNEVIQFSAPSFKTITTYPSYVNYFFHRDTETNTSGGIAASFQSLYEYFDNNKDILLNFVNIGDPDLKETELTDDFDKVATAYCWIFTKSDSTYSIVDASTYVKGNKYYLLYLNTLYFSNFTKVLNFIKTQLWYKYKKDGSEQPVTYQYLYKAANPDASLSPGKLIDSNYIKYTITTALPSMTTKNGRNTLCAGWDNLYLPYPSSKTECITEDENGLGKDAELSSLDANAEYQLRGNDYLLINYTSSSTDDSGNESSTVVNKIYKSGTIIRPSFNLNDSNTVHTVKSTSWSKKTGFTFNDSNISNPEGMFTLSSNEQIEILDYATVSLGPTDSLTNYTNVNIYWVRNDDDANTVDGVLTFKWDDDNTYTLKENEYFFYTNKNKTELAYYGNGTKITRTSPDIELRRSITKEESITADDILQNGLAASIPWLTRTLTKQKNIYLTEYQYINLIKGNILTDLTLENEQTLDETPHTVLSAKYKENEDQDTDTELPRMSLTDNTGWQVRSLLQLNVGPKRAQTLHTNDSVEIYKTGNIDTNSEGTLIFKYPVTWELIETFENVSLKANSLVQSSSSETVIMPYNLLQMKVFDLRELTYTDSNKNILSINYGNYGDGLTNMKLAAKTTFDLYTCIANNHFGLMMFYVNKLETDPTITVEADKGNLSFYNSDSAEKSTLTLAIGINIIEIPAECTKLTVKADDNVASTIIFSNLDIIDNSNILNPKLTSIVTEVKDDTNNLKILSKLKNYSNFYYNAILDSSNIIKFNDNDDSDNLSNTSCWYDYNNMANKFFIAELDADYFDTGIIIDKGSKVK